MHTGPKLAPNALFPLCTKVIKKQTRDTFGSNGTHSLFQSRKCYICNKQSHIAPQCKFRNRISNAAVCAEDDADKDDDQQATCRATPKNWLHVTTPKTRLFRPK